MGCNGGQPGQAWQWFKNTGVVTGLHGHRFKNDLWAVLGGSLRSPRDASHRVSGVPEL